jgi:alpha-L-rhamnosidase
MSMSAVIPLVALVVVTLGGHLELLGGEIRVTGLRCEYLTDPVGIDTTAPRLGWRSDTTVRNWRQRTWQVQVASSLVNLTANAPDLWDSGEIRSDASQQITYRGKPLSSRQGCWWRVRVWGVDGSESPWSAPAQWTMGFLRTEDWRATWISARDSTPVHQDRGSLHLPPARQYRRDFTSSKPIARALLSVASLGIVDPWLNGKRLNDDYFQTGWSDYQKRVYYRVHDVTAQVRSGANCLGAVVADGWYAGYVGYSLLVGYGPYQAGRAHYGKTPALLMQLEITYQDGTQERVVTDPSWQVSDAGPWREADLLMGEAYDARLDQAGWCTAGFTATTWASAIAAKDNGSVKAPFSDNCGTREVELGFQPPASYKAYGAPPIRVVREIRPQAIREHRPGVYIVDLGENIAGNIRLTVTGSAGTTVKMRYGEMLHPDGRLMTENLRKARATDTYILRGDPAGETWTPRFTYHGFQYVELSGLPTPPTVDTITGLVIHNDTPLAGSFSCSDTVFNRLFANIQRTQFANFVEVPTDCPQRDERLGWAGDAQIYARSAAYVADVSAFFTKWLDDVSEAQRPEGPFPDYAPYPMGHGQPGKTFGAAWTDYGIICPWTIWQVYGDTRVIERHWDAMTRFMEWRRKSAPDLRGVSIGNPWGDWLNHNENTPVEYIDAVYFAKDARMMAEMATAIGKADLAASYQDLLAGITTRWRSDWVNSDGTLKVATQTAHVLALENRLLPTDLIAPTTTRLVERIVANGHRMATGFLGTKPLLPALSAHGQHDLAVRMFQSRGFPSWGYEVENGATSIWERWDSYTKEDGFDRHNAAMNSFSHYAFGAVCEWMFRDLAGLDHAGPGMQHLVIAPRPPTAGSNPERAPINAVQIAHTSAYGDIQLEWKVANGRVDIALTVPPNCTAQVTVPTKDPSSIRVDHPPTTVAGSVVTVGSGRWLMTASAQ